ncbi:hypothetical protein Tco_0286424 [Tanacetum coccineum]
MDKRKRFKLNLEIFTDIFKICPRVQGQDFDALPTDEEIVSFLRELGHTREINSLNDVVVDQMHQPWRTFAALINKSLSGKTTGSYTSSKRCKVKKPPLQKLTLSQVSTEEPTETPEIPVSKKREKRIHDHSNEPSSSKLVPKVVPPADKTATSRQEIHKDEMVIASIQLKSISLHMLMFKLQRHTISINIQNHESSTQELRTKTSAQNSEIPDISPSKISSLSRELIAIFLNDAKYEHVVKTQDMQGGKDDQDNKEKIYKISDNKDEVERQ